MSSGRRPAKLGKTDRRLRAVLDNSNRSDPVRGGPPILRGQDWCADTDPQPVSVELGTVHFDLEHKRDPPGQADGKFRDRRARVRSQRIYPSDFT